MKHKKRKTTNSRTTLYLIVLALLVGMAVVYATRSSQTPLQIAEITNSSGSVSLSLESSNKSLLPNTTTTVVLKYNSPTQSLTGAQVDLTYDPTLVTVQSVTPATNLPSTIVAPIISNGKISFAYGVAAGGGAGLKGTGEIATIQLKSLEKIGSTTLSFQETTIVTTLESTTNALKEITDLSLSVATSQASPIASPSLTASASPKASPTASLSPSPSPSSTPLLSPSPSPLVTKPSSPTNLRYNCYNNGTMITLRWNGVSDVATYELILNETNGSNDTTTSVSGTEKDLSLSANSSYTWTLSSLKDGLKSDPSTVSDIKCNSTQASPTPTPTSTPTPTPTPTNTPKPNIITKAVQSLIKPKSPSPTPTPTPTTSQTEYISLDSTPTPGNLADVFKSPEPTPTTQPTNTHSPSLIAKIFLGWQAIFYKLIESLAN